MSMSMSNDDRDKLLIKTLLEMQRDLVTEVNDSNRITFRQHMDNMEELDRQDQIADINKLLLEQADCSERAKGYQKALSSGVDLIHPFTGEPMGIQLMLKFYNQYIDKVEELGIEIHNLRIELGKAESNSNYKLVDKEVVNHKLQALLAVKNIRKLTDSEARQLRRLLAKERIEE
jgi:hypothetical protein